MKTWIKLSVVVLLASSTAVWADIDLSQFNFKSFAFVRKQPRRSYVEELTKELPATQPPVVVAKQPPKQQIILAQAPSENFSDAEPIITVKPSIIMPQPVKIIEEPKVDFDKAVVTANVWVEHHETGEVGLKLSNCDRAIDEKYSNTPLMLECVSKDEGTRYIAKSNRTASDGAYIWNYKTVTWSN